jgi:hypothetical protein
VNDFPDDVDADPSAHSFARATARIVGGIALMLIGGAMIVGGLILHFAEKAGRFELFPVPIAGRLTIVAGVGVFGVAIAMAGARMAIRFGAVTLVVGIGMLAFGFLNIAEPSLRFYAPLGFFIGLAGLGLIWGGREFAKEAASTSKAKGESDPLE